VETFQLPWVQELAQLGAFESTLGGRRDSAYSVLRANGAYRIQTNGPVAAYQFSPLTYRSSAAPRSVMDYSYSNDASLLLPTRALTRRYIVSTYVNQIIGGLPAFGGVNLGGFVAIVGTADSESGTRVSVRLTARVYDPNNRRETIGPGVRQFTLNAGDVIQLVGAEAGQDLTGSVIEADAAVAVYVGNACAQMPTRREACDHVEEQLLPIETWGRRYAVTAFRDRDASYRVRVVSARASNQLSFDGMLAPTECSTPLAAGAFCEFEANGNFVLTGTQPFLVTQYMVGQGAALPECNWPADPSNSPQCMGDPAQVTEIPVDQFRRAYDFLVPDTYARNFINVVVPDGARVRMDGVAFSGAIEPIASGFQLISAQIPAGRHHIEAVDESERIGIKIYGVAPYTSYAYPGGLDLARISPPG